MDTIELAAPQLSKAILDSVPDYFFHLENPEVNQPKTCILRVPGVDATFPLTYMMGTNLTDPPRVIYAIDHGKRRCGQCRLFNVNVDKAAARAALASAVEEMLRENPDKFIERDTKDFAQATPDGSRKR